MVSEAPVFAILLAGGRSGRMGGVDKLWADLDGAPLLARSLRMLGTLPGLRAVVVAAPPERHKAIRSLAVGLGLTSPAGVPLHCVPGGERRRDSVANALAALGGERETGLPPLVLVHDAARPLATTGLAQRVLAAASASGAAIPGVPAADTLKRIDLASDGTAHVVETVDRAALRAAQTPQAFALAVLQDAHAAADPVWDATDDAAMVERLGRPVAVVVGDPRNLKVTSPGDLALVRALVALEQHTEEAAP